MQLDHTEIYFTLVTRLVVNEQSVHDNWGVMKGNEVFKVAVTKLSEVVEQTLAANNMQKSDLDWLVPHQANFRIIKATAKKLDMSLDQVVLTLEKYGNTSAATVPTALRYCDQRWSD